MTCVEKKTKVCSVCREEKDLWDNFRPAYGKTTDGLLSACHDCVREISKMSQKKRSLYVKRLIAEAKTRYGVEELEFGQLYALAEEIRSYQEIWNSEDEDKDDNIRIIWGTNIRTKWSAIDGY